MKNFTYRSHEEKENIEEILRQRKRRINRQQIVAGTVLAVIIGILLLYFGRQAYYTEFDGYVHVDANQVRAPFDIFLDSMYVETGDVVLPGDTLYSYYMMDMMVRNADFTSEPDIVARNRDLTIRYNNLLSQIAVIRVRVEELRKQIGLESHNIQFGLSDNSHKMDLERQLNEALAQLRALQNELGLLGSLKNSLGNGGKGFGSGNGGFSASEQQIYDNIRSGQLRDARNYRLATDSSLIVNVVAPDRMVFFEKELILTSQHIDLMDNNLHVVAYVPVDKIDRITYNSTAEIVVNEEVSFFAHVSIIGARTEEIPEHLRSYFTKKSTALIAHLEIDQGQHIPFWSVASGLPVTIRVKNLETWRKKAPSNYLWVDTGEGISDESIGNFVKRRKHHHVSEIEAEKMREDSIKDAQRRERELNKELESKDSAPIANSTTPSAKARYYLVHSVFSNRENAENAARRVISDGFPETGVLPRSGQWYVYLSRHASLDEAEKQRKATAQKSRNYRDTWILDSSKPEKQ